MMETERTGPTPQKRLITPALQTFLLVGVICLFAFLYFRSCSSENEATQKAKDLQTAKSADSTNQTILRLIEQSERRRIESERDQAATLALISANNRAALDQQTIALVGMMNRQQQGVSALTGLISGGFLPKDRYSDTISLKVPDSAYIAAVASQGRVLATTRETVGRLDLALQNTQQQLSGLEYILLGYDKGISNTIEWAQNKREAASSNIVKRVVKAGQIKVYKEVTTRLTNIQKLKDDRPRKDTAKTAVE